MIEIDKIDTQEAAKNFANLLTKNKTFFLNGAWGSGKTEFINETKKISESKYDKKFVHLDLWNLKDDRTVINIAFDNFLRPLPLILKILTLFCVVIAILMTDVVNLGLESVIKNNLMKITVGLIALTVAIGQFYKLRTDIVYNWLFKKMDCLLQNKILIIDDFDRVSEEKQQEAYKLFNILNGKLPIIFLGDVTKISRNQDNYLQKIIDNYMELPYSLHPKNIWDPYFKKLENSLDTQFTVKENLKALFIEENRNMREQHHFNNYVNLEFLERNKTGHVQVNQQLLIIYLYLFHKDYYQMLLTGWLPTPIESLDKDNNKILPDYFKNDLEKTMFYILEDNDDYPTTFRKNRKGYFLFEYIPNLSEKNAEKMLNDESQLEDYIITHGEREDDFYNFIFSKYKDWWPHDGITQFNNSLNNKILPLPDEIIKLETLAFKNLENNKNSDLIGWIVTQIVERFSFYMRAKYHTDIEQKKYLSELFEKHYLSNFDLSQKIFFYKSFYILTDTQLQLFFIDEIKQLLTNEENYKTEKQKPYLLYMLVTDENGAWKPFAQWQEKVKMKITSLNDDDFVFFASLFRIISPVYTTLENRNEIVFQTSRHTINDNDEEFDKCMIDFFHQRLKRISEARNLTLLYTNGQTTRMEL